MKRKLEMDDIRAGMFITVLEGPIVTFAGPDGKRAYKEQTAFNGKVLEVLSVDMPYIVAKNHSIKISRPKAFDMRIYQFMSLSPDYIMSCCPDIKLEMDEFWDGVEDKSVEESDEFIKEIFKDL